MDITSVQWLVCVHSEHQLEFQWILFVYQQFRTGEINIINTIFRSLTLLFLLLSACTAVQYCILTDIYGLV